MRNSILALLLCGLAAGCSQTGREASPATQARAPQATAKSHAATPEQRCEEAIRAAMDKRRNAAMAGSLLSVVGSFGGFAGRGGAIVGQAASVGGSIVASQGAGDANDAMMEECRS